MMERFHFPPLLKIAAAATFLVAVAGCGDDASANRPVDQAKEKTTTPKKPDEDSADPVPPSAVTGDEDDGTTPADRPPPSTDGSIRECANEPVQTDAVKVVKEFVLPETFTARLGMGTRVNDSGLKQVLSTTWATGYPASDTDYGTGEVTYTGGTRDAIVLTSMLLGKNFAQVNDTFKVKVGDTTPVQGWSAGLAPTGKRLTMVTGGSAQKGSWHLNVPTRTSAAPTIAGTEYVSTVKGRRFFAYKIALEVDSLCKVGKINDVLGKVVDDPTHVLSAGREGYGTGGAIPADPKKRAAMQDVLLKTGAKLTFSVLSNKHRASVAALLDRTSCSSANLDACEELARGLSEEMIFWRDAGTTAFVNYESVVSGTDPNFSVIDFEAAGLR